MWFVVCGLWFVVCGLWFGAWGLGFVVCGLLMCAEFAHSGFGVHPTPNPAAGGAGRDRVNHNLFDGQTGAVRAPASLHNLTNK